MYGYAPRYPTAAAPAGAKFRIVGRGVLAAFLTVPLVAWGAFIAKRETKSYVVSPEARDLVVEGAPRGKIPARASGTSETVDPMSSWAVVSMP
jgi:hypothetical protein